MDSTPCCGCNSWNSGWKVREYTAPSPVRPEPVKPEPVKPEPVTPEPVTPEPTEEEIVDEIEDEWEKEDEDEVEPPTVGTCEKRADTIAQNICQLLKDNGLCWAKATKSQCWKTCDVCTTSDLQDTGPTRTKIEGSWIYTIKTINGVKSVVIKSSIYAKVYIGQLSWNERYHGIGYVVNVLSPGDSYYGSFNDGHFSGKSTYTTKNGDVYSGDFKKNYFWGTGTYSQKRIGQTYTG